VAFPSGEETSEGGFSGFEDGQDWGLWAVKVHMAGLDDAEGGAAECLVLFVTFRPNNFGTRS
jgi:hypothetical protein